MENQTHAEIDSRFPQRIDDLYVLIPIGFFQIEALTTVWKIHLLIKNWERLYEHNFGLLFLVESETVEQNNPQDTGEGSVLKAPNGNDERNDTPVDAGNAKSA